jgi:hypothetical protein
MSDTYRRILDLCRLLDEANIYYTLRRSRDFALMIEVAVPGQRWEIEFVDYGDKIQVEVERFVSTGLIEDAAALEELFANFSDKEEPVTNNVTPGK